MSAVAGLPQGVVVERSVFGRWTDAWSNLNRRHAFGFLLAVLIMATIDVSSIADKLDRPAALHVIAFSLLLDAVLFAVALLAWSAAVAEVPRFGPQRTRALAVAVLATGLLTALIVVPVGNAAGIPESILELMGKKRPLPPLWLSILANTVQFAFFSFLFIAAAEVLQSRAATAAAVLEARREQASGAREVLESRLAAMQAQVEPQFLFNALVAVEALYRKDATAAADNLDRLIQYLRVALPRLREPGSTIGAELDLVQAYLAVVTSLHAGRPVLTVTVGDDCAGARFYPMLLLPLIQRSVRDTSGPLPESIRIGAEKVGNDVVIVSRVACAEGCDEDFELARVRERLAGLYGDRAALDCVALEDGSTQFTLRVPAAR